MSDDNFEKVYVDYLAKAANQAASVYTLTYNTASHTVPAATAVAAATTGSTTTTPYGYTTSAQADAIPVAINALEADVIALKKVIVQLVLDLAAIGAVTS